MTAADHDEFVGNASDRAMVLDLEGVTLLEAESYSLAILGGGPDPGVDRLRTSLLFAYYLGRRTEARVRELYGA